MADIGTIVVRMAADSATLRTDLEKVRRDFKSTGSAADGLGRQLKGLGALAGGVSLVALAAQALQAASALSDLSVRTGIATTALQRLEFAATMSGGSVESIAGAVGRLQKTLVTAGEGSDTARAALSRLGIEASAFLALSPDAQFEAVAQAIARIESPAERATAAMAIFGKSGAELLPTLVSIGENSEELNARFSEMGGPVSETAIAAVDEIGDSLDATKLAVKSLSIELLGLASGALTQALRVTNEWIGSLRILAGGGGEVERLQRKLEILQESRDSIPVFFNFGYVDDGGMVLGKGGLDAAIADVTRQIREMRKEASATDLVFAPLSIDIPEPDIPDFGAKGKPAAGKPEMTAAERRAASDKSYLNTINLQALEAYQLQEQALDQHLANVVAMESAAALERINIASDLEMFRADVAQSFGLQQLDFEAVKNQSMLSLAGELFSALGSESSKLFKVQKAFAIANAIVNVAEGVTKALKLPFPANLAAAAKVAAFGAIQIAKIKATNPGGGAGAPSLGGGGGGANAGGGAALPDGVPGMQQQEPQRIAQVVVQGNLFSARETADWLIEQLSDAVNNRDVVFINGQSRQAGAIAGAA